MKWLAFYYILFFAMLFFARNWLFSVLEEDRADDFNILAKLGWYVLQVQIVISFWSYIFILIYATSNYFFVIEEDINGNQWMAYIAMSVFILPIFVIGKIIYEQGYKRGLKSVKADNT